MAGLMADRKARFALLGNFTKKYKQQTGRDLVINKYAAQWDADALVDSYPKETLDALVARYFVVSDSPSWKAFARDAQKIFDSMTREQEDVAYRKVMRQKVKEWMNQ
jgi:hypothetical protein